MLILLSGGILVFSGRQMELLAEIERLRRTIQELVENKDTLQDQEIQLVSRKLDSVLNEYNRLIGVIGGTRS
jgi:hypothetical protein